MNKINVLACAPTGLAAQDLFEGTTAHSRFWIPIELDSNSRPNFTGDSPHYLPEMIHMADFILLDEISPTHTDLLAYIDKSCSLADQIRAWEFSEKDEQEIPFSTKVRKPVTNMSKLQAYILGCFGWR